MDKPEFDADGYPTDATLDALEQWPWDQANRGLNFIKDAWYWDYLATHALKPEEAVLVHAESDDHFLRLATGGWSGNESLVRAFDKSLASSFTWCLSAIGGLYIYKYRKES